MSNYSRSKHILFVEDNDINQIVFARLIDGENLTCTVCTDGIDALEYLSSRPKIDFIFMDCAMPRMDGYECTKEIINRHADCYANVPIIAITAHDSPDEVNKCLEAGMVDVLTKPFTKPQLLTMLDRYS